MTIDFAIFLGTFGLPEKSRVSVKGLAKRPIEDAQSAIERELVLRLASVLWRLSRATAMETGLFEIEADYPGEAGDPSTTPARTVSALLGPKVDETAFACHLSN